MYMIDTDTCIYAMKGTNKKIVKNIVQNSEHICISSITLSELLAGAYKSKYVNQNLSNLEIFLSMFTIIPFSSNAAHEYSKIRAHLEKLGTPIGSLDMMIAASALASEATLITHNTREFKRVPNLNVKDWF